MNATVAESIWRAVLVRLETRPGLDYWRREHFDELLSIASRAGAAGSPDPTELASATAVSWLPIRFAP